MSSDQTYSDQDKAIFAELEPDKIRTSRPKGGKMAGNAGAVATPNYTQSDLEKFQKMFGSGFEPEGLRRPGEDIRVVSKRDKAANSVGAPSKSEDTKTEPSRSAKAPRKPSATVGKGGRIGTQNSAEIYSDDDLKKFESFEVSMRKAPTSQKQSREPSSATPSERKWRFPELHDQSIPNKPSRPEPSNTGQRRVKLRYFD